MKEQTSWGIQKSGTSHWDLRGYNVRCTLIHKLLDGGAQRLVSVTLITAPLIVAI